MTNLPINISNKTPLKIVIFASGYGTNFQQMIDKFKYSKKIKIVGLFTDNPNAYAIQRANENNIPTEIIDYAKYRPNRIRFDREILKRLNKDKYKPDLIVLAGYLKVIKNPKFFEKYNHRIINIHPALIPAFKGTIHAQEEAFKAGNKISGITIHFVTDDVDGGEIILQKCVGIGRCKSSDDVRKKISKLEHKYYSDVIEMFANGRFEIENNRVKFVKKRN